MHNKRQDVSKAWPIPRKGTKYIVVPSHNKKSGIPLLVVVRDILNNVKTRKELKKILLEKKVLVNGSPAKEENLSLNLFDTLSFPDLKIQYRITLTETGKISLEEIKDSEIGKKISKVMNKKILPKNKIQINMEDGRNILSKEKIKVGDSVLIDIGKKKIEKVFPIVEKSEVMVIKGKHKGKKGTIVKINGKEIIVKSNDKEIGMEEEDIIVTK